MRKYSCSGPTVVKTFFASVFPNSFRIRSAWLLSASMLRIRNRGIGELGTLLDRLLKRAEHRLRQSGLLNFLAEHVDAEQVLDVGCSEVELVQVVVGGGDRLDRQLAGTGHWERAPVSRGE